MCCIIHKPDVPPWVKHSEEVFQIHLPALKINKEQRMLVLMEAVGPDSSEPWKAHRWPISFPSPGAAEWWGQRSMSLANWAEPREGLKRLSAYFPCPSPGGSPAPTSHVTVTLGTCWVLGSWNNLHELGSSSGPEKASAPCQNQADTHLTGAIVA